MYISCVLEPAHASAPVWGQSQLWGVTDWAPSVYLLRHPVSLLCVSQKVFYNADMVPHASHNRTQQAEAGGFEASLGYITKPCLRKGRKRRREGRGGMGREGKGWVQSPVYGGRKEPVPTD